MINSNGNTIKSGWALCPKSPWGTRSPDFDAGGEDAWDVDDDVDDNVGDDVDDNVDDNVDNNVDERDNDNNDEKDGRVPTWLPQMTKQPMKRRMYCADILMEMHILSLYYDYDLTWWWRRCWWGKWQYVGGGQEREKGCSHLAPLQQTWSGTWNWPERVDN